MSASQARKIVKMYQMIDDRDTQIDLLRKALQEADTIMGHDDAQTEWREKWAILWPEAPIKCSHP